MRASHQVREDEVRAALQRILASESFQRSLQLTRLLTYLCDPCIMEGTKPAVEYTIGTQVLGRPAHFDPAQDAAVRVEMHRLRRRLRDYYEGEGKDDAIRILIPGGSYIPCASRNESLEAIADPPPPQLAAEPPALEQTAPAPLLPAAKVTPVRFAVQPRRLMAVAAAAVLLISTWLLWSPRWASATDRHAGARGLAALNPPLLAGRAVRIGCGRSRPWTDRLGQIWAPDAYFEGGDALQIPPRTHIPGAFDGRLYQAARTGNFRYHIPLPAGNYEMRLYFIEPEFGPENDQGEANRLFNIALNGTTRFTRFDIVADADGAWTADVRVMKDVVPDANGFVTLGFESITSVALINAIEFVPARPHVLNPIRLLPQDNFYTDSAGILWSPDNYSMGGRISTHRTTVTNTRDQEMFRHERFGRFRYAVPVDDGSYSLYLYMAEEYWGPGSPAGGGEGSRMFSVFCNGTALLRGLDLFKEAGFSHALIRSFHHLRPNAQGKLALSFEPEHDYASLYALEVLDEASDERPSYEYTVTQGAAKNQSALHGSF